MTHDRVARPDSTQRPHDSAGSAQTAELAIRAEQPDRRLSLEDFRIGQLFWEILDGVAVVDVESGQIVHWNPAAEELFGVAAREAIGQSLDAFLPELGRGRHGPDAANPGASVLGGCLHADQPIEEEALSNTERGLTVELTLSPLMARRVPGSFALAIIRDATARKRAAADQLRLAREHAARAAAEAEAARQAEAAALLDTLLAASPEGFALFDLELRFARVNGAYAEINNLQASAHLGRTLHDVAPDIAVVHEPLIRHVLETGETVRDLEISGPQGGAPGAWRHWLVSYFPVHGRSGARFGVGAVVADITARKRLEQMQQDFLDSVSHDLNSPLAALHIRAQLLGRRASRERSPESVWMREGVSRIEELTARMAGIVSELADAGNLRIGQSLELTRARTDAVALIRRAVEEQQSLTDHHRFTIQTTAASLHGNWDAIRIGRVLANLLGNAVKYSPDGGPVTVGLDKVEKDGESWAVITVRDQGIGIPAADVPRIFERRHRGANVVGKFAGAGIGLSGALQIVEQHGGTITVISRECVGSFFEVRLPLNRLESLAPIQPG